MVEGDGGRRWWKGCGVHDTQILLNVSPISERLSNVQSGTLPIYSNFHRDFRKVEHHGRACYGL